MCEYNSTICIVTILPRALAHDGASLDLRQSGEVFRPNSICTQLYHSKSMQIYSVVGFPDATYSLYQQVQWGWTWRITFSNELPTGHVCPENSAASCQPRPFRARDPPAASWDPTRWATGWTPGWQSMLVNSWIASACRSKITSWHKLTTWYTRRQNNALRIETWSTDFTKVTNIICSNERHISTTHWKQPSLRVAMILGILGYTLHRKSMPSKRWLFPPCRMWITYGAAPWIRELQLHWWKNTQLCSSIPKMQLSIFVSSYLSIHL